jgi:thioredoxin-related protein
MGREIAQRYGVRGVPTFLVFDGQGDLVGRQVGFPNRNEIIALVTGS